MPVTSSGQVSLNDLHVEAGGTTGTECSFNDSDIRGLIDKASGAQMAINEWYGASNVFTFNITSNTNQANLSTLATAAGWNGSSALECTINANVYLYSTSTGTAALIVNVSGAKVTNNGYIMGQGGVGGWGGGDVSASSGGPAINVTASNTTIVNNSGAYIGGGGGGGGWNIYYKNNGDVNYNGGGGGAGGGLGGRASHTYYSFNAGASSPNTRGASYLTTTGADAGGATIAVLYGQRGGFGGGRIMPGSAHTGGIGGGGAPGSSAYNGGGGGWGASGHRVGYGYPSVGSNGGSGGAAITGTARTLTNNGTIYGST